MILHSQISVPSQNALRNDSPTNSTAPTTFENENKTMMTPLQGLPNIVIPSIFQPDLFLCLRPVLSHLHLFWELILTGTWTKFCIKVLKIY